jgi:hypothetical protein
MQVARRKEQGDSSKKQYAGSKEQEARSDEYSSHKGNSEDRQDAVNG